MNQVFVVEAEDPIRETLVKAMTVEGHGVVTASDGYTASTLLQSIDLNQEKFPFDLVILSWTLPKANGQQLCHQLRHQGNLVPILVLSAKANDAERISLLEAGVDNFLLKPFNTQELIALCRVLLRRHHFSPSPKPTVLQFDELSLYLQEHRLLVRGNEVYLSPKEFRLLELFMNHPGRIWSRQQLFEQLWGPDFAGISKNLDVQIRHLREKLELRPARPKYITTVPRIGYRFG